MVHKNDKTWFLFNGLKGIIFCSYTLYKDLDRFENIYTLITLNNKLWPSWVYFWPAFNCTSVAAGKIYLFQEWWSLSGSLDLMILGVRVFNLFNTENTSKDVGWKSKKKLQKIHKNVKTTKLLPFSPSFNLCFG